MNVTTKEEVVQYVISCTQTIQINSNLEPFTTNAVADAIRISRNLASFYLNELEKEQILLKVGGRPVYFLHKKSLEQKYHIHLQDSEIAFAEDLWEILGNGKNKDRKDSILRTGTLNYCISQCKSAVKYPGGGVPVLMWGEAGVGKSYLAEYLYRFLVENQNLKKDAPCLTFTCSPTDQENGKDAAKIFRLLQEASEGMLIIDRAEYLSRVCQDKLSGYLEKKAETGGGQDAKLIFIMRKNPVFVLEESLRTQIPVVTCLPPLRERSDLEKRLLLKSFYEEEERNLRKRIVIQQHCLPNAYEISLRGKSDTTEKLYPCELRQRAFPKWRETRRTGNTELSSAKRITFHSGTGGRWGYRR